MQVKVAQSGKVKANVINNQYLLSEVKLVGVA